MKRLICLLLVVCLLPSLALAAGTLSQGSKGKSVTELQQRLNALGLSSGSADGVYGQKTAAAVEEAQRLLIAAGYDVQQTGKADPQTLALLYDEACEPALRTLLRGSTGTRVTEVQNRLIELGFLKDSADGAFGSQTENAVLAFERFMDIEADGIITPDTFDLLVSDLSQTGLRAPLFFDDRDPLSLTGADLYAPACILIDGPSGDVLFAKNADEPMYPASTTKIVTLLLALRLGDLDSTVTIPQSAADIPADSSRVPVQPGEKMTFRDLLYGLMIRSGNDAANAVAELCSGSVDAFVEDMNGLAAEIGMDSSHFVNPHGYHDEDHYTTARDLAAAARLGLCDPEFCSIVTCLSYTLPATKQRKALTLENNYDIFKPASAFYIPGAAGVKSGYTKKAGFCYVGAAQRDGRTLIAVILHVPGRDRGWVDLKRLFEYGFAMEP